MSMSVYGWAAFTVTERTGNHLQSKERAGVDAAQRLLLNRKPSHHTVQLVLATGPPPSIQTKRYQSWEKIADPAERRLPVAAASPVDAWHGSSGYSRLQLPDYAARKKPQRQPEVIQPPSSRS